MRTLPCQGLSRRSTRVIGKSQFCIILPFGANNYLNILIQDKDKSVLYIKDYLFMDGSRKYSYQRYFELLEIVF